jgi:hypothetical protein
MKDLEDRITIKLYMSLPLATIYDGLSPGMRLHNKTILDNLLSSTLTRLFNKCKTFSGSGLLSSIKIIEIAPFTTRAIHSSFPLCSRCRLFENQSDGAAKH